MPAHDVPVTKRYRRAVVLVVVALAAAALVIGVVSVVRPPSDDDARPSPTAPAPERPTDWSPHRPAVHITPERNWMNDPQKPFLLDGVWHYYYLYNADYPDGNGTAWYHATSTDLVHWRDEGVAIDKYTNGLGDIWTGTAVVDEDGTAGFGAGAVIALVTQQVDGVQRQSLFFSRDGGYSFESYEANPVMDNPGVTDWRDPRVFWDDSAGHWVMALAEHDRIGFYTSPNLRDWTYTSDFSTTGLGVLECPDLFPMSVDGNPERTRWVLVAGANGAAEGRTTGTAYWVGEWDGERFTATDARHQWLDHGPDYYAAVTWTDPRLERDEQLASRYSIAWMNNWAYAGQFPTEDWQGGSDTIVRRIRLSSTDDGVRLESAPAPELRQLEDEPHALGGRTIEAGTTVEIAAAESDAFRLTIELTAEGEGDRGEARIRLRSRDGSFATVGYDFDAQAAFVARDTDAVAEQMPDTYREVRTAPVPAQNDRVRLDVIVDVSSIEVFAGDGDAALSMATFGDGDPRSIEIEAAGNSVSLSNATLVPLRGAPVERTTRDR